MTVLIVEDNAGVRRLLRSALAELAEDIWECCDGADALAAYTLHHPAVVLMDIRTEVCTLRNEPNVILDTMLALSIKSET